MPTTSRLREDCGGPRFLDLRALLVTVPFVLATSVLSSAPPTSRAAWQWFLVNLAAVAATALVVIPLRRIARSRIAPLPVVIATGAAVGGVKGLATSVFGQVFGVVPDLWSDAMNRVPSTVVLGAVLIPALAAMYSAWDRWRAERDVLIVELVRRSIEAGDQDQTSYRHELRDIVDRTRIAVVQSRPVDVAPTLRHVVHHELRPLSARVLANTDTPPQLTARHVLSMAIRQETWSLRVVPLLFAVTSWQLLSRYVGPGEALARSALMTLVLILVLIVASPLRPHRRVAAEVYLIGVIVVATLLQRILVHAVMGVVEPLGHVGTTITTAVWLGELLVATAVITSARHDRDAIRSRLLELRGPQGVRDAIGHGVRAIEGREFAFFIHGHLQNQLLASAHRFETSDTADDHRKALQSALDVLDHATALPSADTSLEERLQDLVTRWSGLATLSVHLELESPLGPGHVADSVIHVVVEAVTNAVRHGMAANVDVTVAHDGGAVVVVVTDDGFGPRRGPPSTGSRYFDMVSGGSWTLEGLPRGGSRLRVQLSDATRA